MRARLVAAATLAAGLALVSAVPSGAAAAAPQVTDPTGDGNGVSGSVPVSASSLDIVSILWSTKFSGSGKKRMPTDVIVTMTLAGPIADQGKSGIWRAIWNVGDCQFLASYSTSADADPDAGLRVCSSDPADTLGYHDYPAKAAGSGAKIVWTLPIKSLKPFGVKVGTSFGTLNGHTRILMGTGTTGGATIVTVDDAKSGGSYKVGK